MMIFIQQPFKISDLKRKEIKDHTPPAPTSYCSLPLKHQANEAGGEKVNQERKWEQKALGDRTREWSQKERMGEN